MTNAEVPGRTRLLADFHLVLAQMLGTITQNKETFALVKAGPNLYRVKKGNYMGQNFGVITGIDEAQISLKELVQDSTLGDRDKDKSTFDKAMFHVKLPARDKDGNFYYAASDPMDAKIYKSVNDGVSFTSTRFTSWPTLFFTEI